MDLSKLKDRVSHQLADIGARGLAWAERQPRILRPAIYGAAFIWFLILVRGGLVLLPLLLIVALVTDPASLLQFLIVALVLAPAGGFLGGLLFGVVSPITDRLGILG